MTLLNILNGLNLEQIKILFAVIGALIAIFYMAVWLGQKQIDKDKESADRAVAYNKRVKKYSTEYYNDLARTNNQENKAIAIRTEEIKEDNKRLGI